MSDIYVAIDFDGTMVRHRYPDVGEDIGAAPWIRDAAKLGAKIILYTMRDGDRLAQAVAWCKSNGIDLWAVNENPSQKAWTDSPKIYAHIYIDDHSLGVPLKLPNSSRPYVDWERAGPTLLGKIRDRLCA